ncbi:MAG: hypothetical protein D6814_14060, partial [Calditrichaeota bacterium]
VFYGCSNYPTCKFATWNKPVAKTCPHCGNPYLEERYSQAKGNYLYCPKCKAEIRQELREEDAKIPVG